MLPAAERPGRLLCLVGMCAAFAGIGTGHFSQYFIYLDLFSHLTLHFAVAAIALGWAVLLPRHRLATAVGLMAAGMLAIGLWVHFYPRELAVRGTQPVPPGFRELRVMSFNAWMKNEHQSVLRTEIERQDPDVVFLAEVWRPTRAMAESMSDAFPYQYPPRHVRGVWMRLMSRIPLQDVEVQGPWLGPVYIKASLGPAWGNLNIVGTHTLRIPHINAQWKQINALADRLASVEAPMLVMGDFNATPYSRMVRTFSQKTGLVRRSQLPTWPSNSWRLPQIAIDHMFADQRLVFPDGVRVGEAAGSDHLPIVARVLVPVSARSAELAKGAGR